VVTRDPVRRAEVRHDWPGVPVFDTQADLLPSGLEDAVTITTPPGTRRPLVLEALAAGMHVVAGRAAGLWI
jgi:predicted dehydrogenase